MLSWETFRLKMFTSFSPLNIDQTEIKTIIRVVVFSPPPVEPGDAPISFFTLYGTEVFSHQCHISGELLAHLSWYAHGLL